MSKLMRGTKRRADTSSNTPLPLSAGPPRTCGVRRLCRQFTEAVGAAQSSRSLAIVKSRHVIPAERSDQESIFEIHLSQARLKSPATACFSTTRDKSLPQPLYPTRPPRNVY